MCIFFIYIFVFLYFFYEAKLAIQSAKLNFSSFYMNAQYLARGPVTQ